MDELVFERAAEIEQQRRDDAVALAQRALAGPGQPDCSDCGAEISTARRAAVPGALRCAPCQQTTEARNRCRR